MSFNPLGWEVFQGSIGGAALGILAGTVVFILCFIAIFIVLEAQ